MQLRYPRLNFKKDSGFRLAEYKHSSLLLTNPVKVSPMVRLHHGENPIKLVGFREQKEIFYSEKTNDLERILP